MRIALFQEVKVSQHRAVAFIEGHQGIMTLSQFRLWAPQDSSRKRGLLANMDLWVDSFPYRSIPHRFHGWDKSQFEGQFTMGHVFYHGRSRLYGFLDSPFAGNGFQVFVPVEILDCKDKNETSVQTLKRVARGYQDCRSADVMGTLKVFPLRK